MNKYWQHFKTITKHKFVVWHHCACCGQWWRGFMHDNSKFGLAEFCASARYFQGDKSPIEAQKAAEGYSAAWQHHKGHNPHHWEYWTDFDKDGNIIAHQIPYPYVIEMICDWIGAGQTYNKDKWTEAEPLNYFEKTRAHRYFHPVTEAFLRHCLKAIECNGLKKFYIFARHYGKAYYKYTEDRINGLL